MSRNRHESRVFAVQFLFQRDFNEGKLDEALEEFWRDREPDGKIKSFAEKLINGVEANRAELDRRIQEHAVRWSTNRMVAVDRNVMRVALFEMLHCPDIPPVVSINEAVDIAKDLSGEDSGKFVNGILDKAMRELNGAAAGGES